MGIPQSALDAQKDVGINTNQTISDLQSALKDARENAERLVADYDAKVARFQRDNSNLESALGAQKEAVGKANQKVSGLEAVLEAARVGAETPKTDS